MHTMYNDEGGRVKKKNGPRWKNRIVGGIAGERSDRGPMKRGRRWRRRNEWRGEGIPRGRDKEWNVRSLKGCTHGEDGEDGRGDMWPRSAAYRIALPVISSGSYSAIVWQLA